MNVDFLDFIFDTLGLDVESIPIEQVDADNFDIENGARTLIDSTTKSPIKIIFSKNIDKNSLTFYGVLAHELRHWWQLQLAYNGNKKWKKEVASFQPKDEAKHYNKQLIEIDAVAFSNMTMRILFHCKPIWDNTTKTEQQRFIKHEQMLASGYYDIIMDYLE